MPFIDWTGYFTQCPYGTACDLSTSKNAKCRDGNGFYCADIKDSKDGWKHKGSFRYDNSDYNIPSATPQWYSDNAPYNAAVFGKAVCNSWKVSDANCAILCRNARTNGECHALIAQNPNGPGSGPNDPYNPSSGMYCSALGGDVAACNAACLGKTNEECRKLSIPLSCKFSDGSINNSVCFNACSDPTLDSETKSYCDSEYTKYCNANPNDGKCSCLPNSSQIDGFDQLSNAEKEILLAIKPCQDAGCQQYGYHTANQMSKVQCPNICLNFQSLKAKNDINASGLQQFNYCPGNTTGGKSKVTTDTASTLTCKASDLSILNDSGCLDWCSKNGDGYKNQPPVGYCKDATQKAILIQTSKNPFVAFWTSLNKATGSQVASGFVLAGSFLLIFFIIIHLLKRRRNSSVKK